MYSVVAKNNILRNREITFVLLKNEYIEKYAKNGIDVQFYKKIKLGKNF